MSSERMSTGRHAEPPKQTVSALSLKRRRVVTNSYADLNEPVSESSYPFAEPVYRATRQANYYALTTGRVWYVVRGTDDEGNLTFTHYPEGDAEEQQAQLRLEGMIYCTADHFRTD
jgi:hypothetical protein